MAGTIIIVLVVLLFLGYIQIPGLFIKSFILFKVNNHMVSLWDALLFIIVLWAIEILPSPIREISVITLLLWVLALLGIITINGMSNVLFAVIIIGIVLSFTRK